MRAAHEIDTAANQGNAIWLEPPCLAALRVLLAEATPASLTTARQLAETYLRQADTAHHTRKVIQAAALNALAWRALRRTPEALAALERALALAEPRGFVRTFLDLGAPLAELLQADIVHPQFERRGQRSSERRSSPYVRRLSPPGHRQGRTSRPLAGVMRSPPCNSAPEIAADNLCNLRTRRLRPRRRCWLAQGAPQLRYRRVSQRFS